jgi:DNA-binding MarR family transcriptional regulator
MPDGEQPELGGLLSRLLAAVIDKETPILAAHGLTMWEYVILNQLVGGQTLSQKELARRSRRDPTRLIGHLDALAGRGLIAREVDGSDRRRRAVRLSAKGVETVTAAKRDIYAMEVELLQPLSLKDQAVLRKSLSAILPRDED